MNFFLDENFPKKVINVIEKAEDERCNFFDNRGTNFEGCNDKLIFDKAQKKKAVFLTTDKDFFHTIPFLYTSHYGIIVIALSQPNSKKIVDKFKIALNFIQNQSIKSKTLLMTDKSMYLYSK